MKLFFLHFYILCLVIFLGACNSTPSEPERIMLDVQLAEDIIADPVTSRDPSTGRALSNNLYSLFDLDTNELILSSSVTDKDQRRTDSSGTIWDIGFRGTTVIFNGGVSGPGEATAQILTLPFETVFDEPLPSDGYVTDGSNTTCPSIETPAGPVPGSTLAICTGSGNGWYNYNSNTQLITPIPGRTIAFTTATGNYGALRFLSYYKGNPNPPDSDQPSRHYTFEYLVQPDGSRNLFRMPSDN